MTKSGGICCRFRKWVYHILFLTDHSVAGRLEIISGMVIVAANPGVWPFP